MTNTQAAEKFCTAIKTLAERPDAMEIFEAYLSRHFDKWLKRFANTPEQIAEELQHFAE